MMACRPQLSFLCVLSLSFAATPPPPLPESFSIAFRETFSGFPAPQSTGAWMYDFPAGHWRAEHHAPQTNNFCSCSNNATTDSCALIFTKSGMYVDFYETTPPSCCRLCGEAEGCTPLTPDWLSGNSNKTYIGVDSNGCGEWCVPGDQAASDCLSYSSQNPKVPCAYSETFDFGSTVVVHNLTFDAASFKPGRPPAAAFALRPDCQKPCTRLFPAQCG